MTDLDIKRRAAELLQKGRYDEAVEEYQALLGQSKKPNPAILNLIGDIYCKQQNLERGFDAYLRAARAYSEEGLFHNAIAVGKKILRLDRDQVDVYGMLGSLYARQGLGMDCVKFLNEFARRKDAAGEYPAALAAFADVCEKMPAFAEVHVVYGDMLDKVNRKDEAAASYRQASQAYGDRGRADLAAKWSEKARRLKHPDAEPQEEEQVAGLMSLRTLDETPAKSASRPPSRTMSRPKSGATERPLELETRGQFWGRNEEPDGLGTATPVAPETGDSKPWKPFDAKANPALPKPPPLPPRRSKGPAADAPVAPSIPVFEIPLPPAPQPAAMAPPAMPEFPAMPAIEPAIESAPAAKTPSKEIVWDLSLDAVPMQSEATPAPEDDMVSTLGHEPLRGSMRSLDETASVEATATNMPEPALEATPDPFESPTAVSLDEFFEDAGGSVEQAVVIGDDFELVREGGDVLEVIADFRNATREILDLDDHQAHYDLGTTYLEMELFDDAVAEFEIASRGNAFALPSQEMLGYCFLRKGQIDLAIRELEKALALPGYDERDRLGIHYNLGIACGVTDRENDAIEHFQKILEIDPNFRDTRSRLERLVQNSH